MRRFAHRGLMIAVAGAAAVTVLAACGSTGNTTLSAAKGYPGGFGSIPGPSGTPHATTITWAEANGATPNWIFPIDTSGSNSVFNAFTFQDEMWRPLYWTVKGVEPTFVPNMSLASLPTWSNGGKTATITMNSAYKWSNGSPVTSKDLLFSIDLIKAAIAIAPSNWAGYVPGYFPADATSITAPNAKTLVINLKSAINPSYFALDLLSSVVPLPSSAWSKDAAGGPTVDFTVPANATKIYNYLLAQNKSVSTYSSNSLWKTVDGPYSLTAFNATTGAFTMSPNNKYGGPHVTPMSTFVGQPYTSDTAEFNAVRAGSVDVAYIPSNDVNQVSAVKAEGYDVFGIPDFGMQFGAYNFKDQTGHFASIANQLYFRQAMAHLQSQPGYIKAFMDGAGDGAYGPIPAYPKSPYLPSNAATNPYPFSTSAASALLKANGWNVVAGGVDTCAKAGSAAGDCGAGIPAGTPLSFNYIYNTTPVLIGQQATDLVSEAKQVGIKITLQPSNFNYMITNYIDPAAPQNENKWAMLDFGGETAATYPTTFGLFNTGGGFQVGDYSNPTADRLITASITSSNPAAVKTEAQFLTTQQPVMFQPNPDLVWAWKKNLSSQNPDGWANLTQYYATPEFWYSTK